MNASTSRTSTLALTASTTESCAAHKTHRLNRGALRHLLRTIERERQHVGVPVVYLPTRTVPASDWNTLPWNSLTDEIDRLVTTATPPSLVRNYTSP
jgi:hypothetical protein